MAETGPPFFVERMTHSQIKEMMRQRNELIEKVRQLVAENATRKKATNVQAVAKYKAEAEVRRLRRALWVYHDRLKNYPELRNLVGADVMELSQDSYDRVEAEAEAEMR